MDRVIKNQNANETDYDKQYNEDLERATALSLETLALEEFRRNRSLQSVSATGATGATGDLSSASSSSSMKFSSCMCCKYVEFYCQRKMKKFHLFVFLVPLQHKIIYQRSVGNRLSHFYGHGPAHLVIQVQRHQHHRMAATAIIAVTVIIMENPHFQHHRVVAHWHRHHQTHHEIRIEQKPMKPI